MNVGVYKGAPRMRICLHGYRCTLMQNLSFVIHESRPKEPKRTEPTRTSLGFKPASGLKRGPIGFSFMLSVGFLPSSHLELQECSRLACRGLSKCFCSRSQNFTHASRRIGGRKQSVPDHVPNDWRGHRQRLPHRHLPGCSGEPRRLGSVFLVATILCCHGGLRHGHQPIHHGRS